MTAAPVVTGDAGSVRAFVGLGANLGDRARRLGHALVELERRGARVERVSAIWESAPVGPVREQPPFYNAVACIATPLAPRALLAACQDVERVLGRSPGVPHGPRVIDLDLLLWGDLVAAWPELVLPHPELARRGFVLAPLLELAPDLRDPRSGEALSAAWGRLSSLGEVVRVGMIDIEAS